MKLKLKYLLMIVLSFLMIVPQKVFAQDYKNFDIKSVSNDSYTVTDIGIINVGSSTNPRDLNAYIGRKISNYVIYGSVRKDNEPTRATLKWHDPDYVIKEGEQTVTLDLVNTPDGTITAEVYINGVIDQKAVDEAKRLEKQLNEDAPKDTAEESTVPSLTASSIMMAKSSTYDINILDKVKNSTYSWTSSNPSIATVNPKTGVVTGVKNGKAKITCKVVTPEKTYTLISNITVGLDDDNPTLSDSEVELNSGDTFDLDIENQIVKSKYKFVSSDKSVAKVNSSTGVITAVKKGTATVKCIVQAPNKQVYVLECEVNVSK